MRLMIILLLFGMMQVSATTYGQRITLRQQNISLRQVFKVIKAQTGYDVLWQGDKLNTSRTIMANFNQAPLERVMQECLYGEDLGFLLQERTIVIMGKKEFHTNEVNIQQDSVIFKGRVIDEIGKPMPGATVRILGGTKTTKTDTQGNFAIYGPKRGTLTISYLGYLNKEITLNGLNPNQVISVSLIPGTNNLGEVNVVSTGYQDLPKERATGSFEVITKEQLQHSTDPNLIKRLEGITTSMNFNNQLQPTNSADRINRSNPLANLTIRGKNSLEVVNTAANTSGQVLVVIDGIASPYSIDLVNPNDVESITVLKDAASASIWGSRAANGVIVVKTKAGNYDRALDVSFNNNINITDKFNLFYKQKMSTSDFINAQIFQFNKQYDPNDPNAYIGDPTINSSQPLISPVAEILNNQKRGRITSSQASDQINSLRNNDIRKDYDQYILRSAINQSYSLGLGSGNKKMAWRLSGAYDHSDNNTVRSGNDRIVLGYNISLRPLKKIELQVGAFYNLQRTIDQTGPNSITSIIDGSTYFPYSRLADDLGNPLIVPKTYRPAFTDLLTSTYGNKILNYSFIPLNDIYQGYNKTNSQSINLRLQGNYIISDVFSANIIYNFNKGNTENDVLFGENSFYMRDLINRYTNPNTFAKNIPLGGLYVPSVTESSNQTLRGQININKNWNKNALSAIVGVDVSQNYFLSRGNQYYGYSESSLRSNNLLNFSDNVTLLFGDPIFGFNTAKIPYQASGIIDQKIRAFSSFANAAYTYNKRYTISASVRKDMSSEFGLGTNKGGTPYYSFGSKWDIAKEPFYNISWLPNLSLRSTFGYNGNVNPRTTARPILTYSTQADGTTGLFNANVGQTGQDASNRLLRPEKSGIWNTGIDFGLPNGRLSGSIEYYDKRTHDLISSTAVDPTTGFNNLTINTANIHSWGSDLTINSKNLQLGLFSWTSNFLFSYNRVKVTKLYTRAASTALQVVAGSPSYNEGADLSRLYAFRWAGLDPLTGDPRGYLNGQAVSISANSTGNSAFSAIQAAPSSTARYFGSAVPVYFGSLRNTFNYKGFSLSANILFKLGYYFRRPFSDIVNYSQLYSASALQGGEYNQRWQKTGDELHTNVPSLTYPTSSNRDLFYYLSEINVEKGDHIRFQEINLSYGFSKKNWFIKNPRIYANVSNLGVIWRANKLGLDPDVFDYPIPRNYSLGLSANF